MKRFGARIIFKNIMERKRIFQKLVLEKRRVLPLSSFLEKKIQQKKLTDFLKI